MKEKPKDETAHVAGDTCLSRSYITCVEVLTDRFTKAYETRDSEVLAHEEMVSLLEDAKQTLLDDDFVPDGDLGKYLVGIKELFTAIWKWGVCAALPKYQSNLERAYTACRYFETLVNKLVEKTYREGEAQGLADEWNYLTSLVFSQLLFTAEAMATEKAAQVYEPSKRVNDGGGKASGKKYKKYAVSTWEMAQVMCGLENSRATLNELKKEIKTKKEAELSKEQRALKAMERTLRNAEVRLRDGKNIRLKATVNRMSVIYSLSLREDEGKAFTWARCYCAEQKIEKPKISYSGNLEGKLAIENLRAKGIPMPQNKNNDY